MNHAAAWTDPPDGQLALEPKNFPVEAVRADKRLIVEMAQGAHLLPTPMAPL